MSHLKTINYFIIKHIATNSTIIFNSNFTMITDIQYQPNAVQLLHINTKFSMEKKQKYQKDSPYKSSNLLHKLVPKHAQFTD